MSSKPLTMLTGLKTVELTLTKRGVNDRRFAVTKGGFPMDPEVLQAIIGTPAEGEAEFVETLKSQGMSDQEKLDAAVASYRMQKGMRDLVDDDTMSAVAKSAGYVAKAVTPEEGVRDDKTYAESGKVDPKAKKKDKLGKSVDLSGLDRETRDKIDAVFKSNAAHEERAAKLEEMVKSLVDQREEQQYVAKAAKEYGDLPISDKDLGLMLKSAHDVGPEFAKNLEGMLGRLDAAVKKSEMLTGTIGSASRIGDGNSGQSKLQAKAAELVSKSSEPITIEKAMAMVLDSAEGNEIYSEFLAENPAQRSRY